MNQTIKLNFPLGIMMIILGIFRIFVVYKNFNMNELLIIVLCITLGIKQLEYHYMYKKLMILLKLHKSEKSSF